MLNLRSVKEKTREREAESQPDLQSRRETASERTERERGRRNVGSRLITERMDGEDLLMRELAVCGLVWFLMLSV